MEAPSMRECQIMRLILIGHDAIHQRLLALERQLLSITKTGHEHRILQKRGQLDGGKAPSVPKIHGSTR